MYRHKAKQLVDRPLPRKLNPAQERAQPCLRRRLSRRDGKGHEISLKIGFSYSGMVKQRADIPTSRQGRSVPFACVERLQCHINNVGHDRDPLQGEPVKQPLRHGREGRPELLIARGLQGGRRNREEPRPPFPAGLKMFPDRCLLALLGSGAGHGGA